jgi:phosphoribosylanthranilate isomerase
MIIQIYAFTRIDEVVQAASAGVDQIGFVAGEYGIVHGELDFITASKLAHAVPPPAQSIALTMSTDVNEILRMAEAVKPNIVHISSETGAVGIAKLMELRIRLNPNIKIMKAVGVVDESSIDDAVNYAAVSDILLLDTKIKQLPGVGATGKTHDWLISHKIVEKCHVPVILAGGLNAENVATAIQQVKPWGVDSNTSTNIPGSPFAKDISRIREFVAAIRSIQDGVSIENA